MSNYCAKCTALLNLFWAYNYVVFKNILFSFDGCENWGWKKLSNFPKLTQLVSDKIGILAQLCVTSKSILF